MEGNREDALKCIEIAKKASGEGDIEKARRFLLKAQRLFPTQNAQNLLDEMTNEKCETERDKNGASKNSSKEKHYKFSKTKSDPLFENEENRGADYTTEQLEAVKRIRQCVDYYEVLGVSKDAGDSLLKKSYRKLALQFHPDKNKAPGASEAFKVIGNAFAILSDCEKRKQYDLYGPESSSNNNQRHQRQNGFYHMDPSNGFEADMTAEEIFSMFFGGGTIYTRRNGTTHRATYFTQQPRTNENGRSERETSGYALIMQLMPIILIITMSLFSSFFANDPLYSFKMSSKYNNARLTSKMKIPYYVKDNFHTEFSGSFKRFEVSVEEDYMTSLRHACFKEKNYKENLLWQARYSGNNALLNRAHNYATPSCDNVEKIYSQ